jgi:hypothetical protein
VLLRVRVGWFWRLVGGVVVCGVDTREPQAHGVTATAYHNNVTQEPKWPSRQRGGAGGHPTRLMKANHDLS